MRKANPVTPAAKEKTVGHEDFSGEEGDVNLYDEKETLEDPPEEADNQSVEPEVKFSWYKPADDDKDRFTNMGTRLASRATGHLIMLAI